MQGEELRWEERLLSWTGVCVDRVGAFNDLSKGVFRMPSTPLAPARPESHQSLGKGGPTRPTHAYQLG
jgi:hypothetical protein